MVVSGSRKKKVGSVAYNPPEGKDYKWHISGIYCQLGLFIMFKLKLEHDAN